MRVYVTRELFPFTAGGIGRVVANILSTARPEERAGIAVVYVGTNVEPAQFSAVYPGVVFRVANQDSHEAFGRAHGRFPRLAAYAHSVFHFESVAVLQQLIELEDAGHELEYVEFPDWGGSAFAATQDKRLGRSLTRATLAVRLHTTDSLLASIEARKVDHAGLVLYDLERKALADCDLIVSQLVTVAPAVRDFYGFPAEEWDARVVVDAPPVLLDHLPVATAAHPLALDTPITFTSKIQHVKRPDVFIQGVVHFLKSTPQYVGEVLFLAHGFDPAYQQVIRDYVPESFNDRVKFLANVRGEARESIISKSVCVFPSAWESFCLAAYEASLLGATCVLNRANVAFADGTPWVDGGNCIKFDGSATGLASALSSVFGNLPDCVPVHVDPAPAPWLATGSVPPQPGKTATARDVEFLILNRGSGVGVLHTIDMCLEAPEGKFLATVIDNASGGPFDSRVLDTLAESEGVRIIRADSALPWPDLIAAAARASTAEFLVILGCENQVDGQFVRQAVRALRQQPGYGFVSCAYAVDDAHGILDPGVDKFAHEFSYVGDAVCSGLFSNRYAGHVFVIRRQLVAEHGFRTGLPFGTQWEFFMRLGALGVKGLADSRLCAGETGPGTLDQPVEVTAPPELGYNEIVRDKHLRFGSLQLPMYLLSLQVALNLGGGSTSSEGHHVVEAGATDNAYMKLKEYENSEVVQLSLKAARYVQRSFPWALPLGAKVASRLVRGRRGT